ncbi:MULTISPECIES: helix-turn-helix domain-containing protein [Stappiaceae]|uniref:HTH cro/C1-type domain-containing protein n=1 Tax=Pseudovibrio exalbescens TaxID=197461 RepID=A0A1U7JJV3_9HYPH|nr:MULTISPECIES: helix-turn-helix transcriptional regulator [Pseudovibrio]MDX5595633.1 helix-turn-helix transcriptional regulator [Pseudovibrio sp. SPO723]OKL45030.1 hypothetical protein A3843_05445 [Pseudovibrio exalbescens]
MKKSTVKPNEEDLWDRRRRNLAAIIAYKRMTPKEVSEKAGYSINTVSKFLRADTKSLRWSTLEAICSVIGLPSAQILDSDNPLSTAKAELYELINGMSEDEARSLLDKLK